MNQDWFARRWGSVPHVTKGDPCRECGVPMMPASRWANGPLIPVGYRRHGSHGLCSRCYSRVRASS